MKIIVLIGPPGVGKGTQATLLSNKLNLKMISTGALLRSNMEGDQLLWKVIAEGNYASDELVSSLVQKEISANQACWDGFILDGYPRTILQAEFLDNIAVERNYNELFFVCLNLADSILIDRLILRFVCKGCNTTYNRKTSPPKIANICDKCRGTDFFTRSDDNIDSIKVRLLTYKNQTQQIINYYQDRKHYLNLVADGSADNVHSNICNFIDKMKNST